MEEDEGDSVPEGSYSLFLETKFHNPDSWIIQTVQVLPACFFCKDVRFDAEDLQNHLRSVHPEAVPVAETISTSTEELTEVITVENSVPMTEAISTSAEELSEIIPVPIATISTSSDEVSEVIPVPNRVPMTETISTSAVELPQVNPVPNSEAITESIATSADKLSDVIPLANPVPVTEIISASAEELSEVINSVPITEAISTSSEELANPAPNSLPVTETISTSLEKLPVLIPVPNSSEIETASIDNPSSSLIVTAPSSEEESPPVSNPLNSSQMETDAHEHDNDHDATSSMTMLASSELPPPVLSSSSSCDMETDSNETPSTIYSKPEVSESRLPVPLSEVNNPKDLYSSSSSDDINTPSEPAVLPNKKAMKYCPELTEVQKVIRRRLFKCCKCSKVHRKPQNTINCLKSHGFELCHICFSINRVLEEPMWAHNIQTGHFNVTTSLWTCPFPDCRRLFNCEINLKGHIGQTHLWKKLEYRKVNHGHDHELETGRCLGVNRSLKVPQSKLPFQVKIYPAAECSRKMEDDLQGRILKHLDLISKVQYYDPLSTLVKNRSQVELKTKSDCNIDTEKSVDMDEDSDIEMEDLEDPMQNDVVVKTVNKTVDLNETILVEKSEDVIPRNPIVTDLEQNPKTNPPTDCQNIIPLEINSISPEMPRKANLIPELMEVEPDDIIPPKEEQTTPTSPDCSKSIFPIPLDETTMAKNFDKNKNILITPPPCSCSKRIDTFAFKPSNCKEMSKSEEYINEAISFAKSVDNLIQINNPLKPELEITRFDKGTPLNAKSECIMSKSEEQKLKDSDKNPVIIYSILDPNQHLSVTKFHQGFSEIPVRTPKFETCTNEDSNRSQEILTKQNDPHTMKCCKKISNDLEEHCKTLFNSNSVKISEIAQNDVVTNEPANPPKPDSPILTSPSDDILDTPEYQAMRPTCCFCDLRQHSVEELKKHNDSCPEKAVFYRLEPYCSFEIQPHPKSLCKICGKDLKSTKLKRLMEHVYWCAAAGGINVFVPVIPT